MTSHSLLINQAFFGQVYCHVAEDAHCTHANVLTIIYDNPWRNSYSSHSASILHLKLRYIDHTWVHAWIKWVFVLLCHSRDS